MHEAGGSLPHKLGVGCVPASQYSGGEGRTIRGPQQVQEEPGPRLARKRHLLKQKRKPAQGDNEENSNG